MREQLIHACAFFLKFFFYCFSKLTIDGTSTGDVWPKYNGKDMKYLLIKSATPKLSARPFVDEYEFWSGLPLTSNINRREHLKTEL